MEIAKQDLKLKEIFDRDKKNEEEFIREYIYEIVDDSNKYLKKLKRKYKEIIKLKGRKVEEKISSLIIILQHLEKVSNGELNKSEKAELKYDLKSVLNEIEKLKKEKDMFKI